MIKGLSYQNGIFFIGKKYVGCAYDGNGKIVTWAKPLSPSTLLVMFKQMFFSLPLWFKFVITLYVGLIFVPKGILLIAPNLELWEGLPFYFLFYLLFGTHFFFPKKLRKYHGAEHKVFSDRGIKKRSRLFAIKRAAITNRHCSTNVVVIYFSLLFLLMFCLLLFFPLG